MIKNDHQLAVTKARLGELQSHLARLRQQYPEEADFVFYSEATRDTIEAMKREIRDYSLVKSASVERILKLWDKRGSVHPKNKSDLSLGELIAMLRIARGLTQEQLAQRLGIQQAHVARYEQRGYSGYTLETLSNIFGEPGAKLAIEPLSRRKAA